MTSNIGSEYLLDNANNVEQVTLALKRHFKPEFINRIDDIVYFNSLNEEVIGKIVDKFIGELETRLGNLEISIDVSTSAKKEIIAQGFDKIYGARPLKRFIQKEIETPLAREIIARRISPKSRVKVSFEEGQFTFDKE